MYYDDNTTIFLNGKWLNAKDATTDLYAQTLHYGSGVFEGIRSYKTQNGTSVYKAKEHYERLHYSAEKMHINLEYSVEQIVALTYELLDQHHLPDAYIHPLLYLGQTMSLDPTEEVNVFLCAWTWERYLGDQQL